MNELVVVEKLTPAVVFAPGGVDAVIAKIEGEVRSFKADISTDAGRKAIASIAYKVARSKTALDDMGKELVSDLKAQTSKIDAERRTIRDRLDALKDEVRKPLTDWENAEKNRVDVHEAALARIQQAAQILEFNPPSKVLREQLANLGQIAQRDWQEFATRADEALSAARSKLETALKDAEKREHDAAELERLRAEQAAREQREREEQIAREAAEKARKQAEEKAAADAAAAAEAARKEQERVEAERHAARLEAVRAENERREAQLRADAAESARIEQAAQAERDRIAAQERAKREQQEAVEAERQRAAAAQEAEQVEARKREADKKHRAKINGEARDAFVSAGLTAEQATAAVTAIARGEIPHIRISY